MVFCLLGAAVGCQYDPFAHRYTTVKPKEADLFGTYLLDIQTADHEISEFRDSTGGIVFPMIKLNTDGSFEAENLPVFESESMGATFMGLVSVNGSWIVSTVGSIDNGSDNLKKHWGIYMPDLPRELRSAGLINNEPPYEIIFGVGDPDAGEAMVFKRSK